jgi:hypothetical protein
MVFELNKWLDIKREGDVIVEHMGGFTSTCIDSILVKLENSLDERHELDTIKKKIFHIFVECIQNLFHHVDKVENMGVQMGADRPGVIMLVKDGSFAELRRATLSIGIKKSHCGSV